MTRQELKRHRKRRWCGRGFRIYGFLAEKSHSYGGEEIHISGGKLVVKVRGSGLELRSMNASQLLITGVITAVELE